MSARFWWTDDRVARMRRGLAAGRTARQVGGELGCSRSSVLSKMRALDKAEGRLSSAAKRKPTPRGVEHASCRDVRLLDEIDALPVAAGVRIRDLRMSHCRWVEAPGAPWVFCGEPATCGSYCAAHAGRVYAKPKASRSTGSA